MHRAKRAFAVRSGSPAEANWLMRFDGVPHDGHRGRTQAMVQSGNRARQPSAAARPAQQGAARYRRTGAKARSINSTTDLRTRAARRSHSARRNEPRALAFGYQSPRSLRRSKAASRARVVLDAWRRSGSSLFIDIFYIAIARGSCYLPPRVLPPPATPREVRSQP